MGPVLDEAGPVEHQDAIGGLGGGHAVGDCHHGSPGCQL